MRALKRTSKTNTVPLKYQQVTQQLKSLIPQALEIARGAYRQLLPPRRFRRRLSRVEMLHRYLRMTPEEHEALRQQVGEERYRAYVIAMNNLYNKLRGERWP